MGTMSERSRRASDLFDAALDLAPAERIRFLDQQCGTDVDLRRAVELLVSADEECARSAFLDTPLPQAAAVMFSDFSDLHLVGQTIGEYRLTHVLGAGGMGIVFRGESVDDAGAEPVAVKLIRNSLFVTGVLQRFQCERQLLAQLHHPNIAALLDAGVTDQGVPYLIMEYVEGLPIDTYCDAKRFSIRRRVELMRDVCLAVQHAHQHLIVHRDIKPANLLVTDDDSVKLLDFGVSKLLGDDPTSHAATGATAAFRMMTPQYAGPEVVRGEPITTAVDVYALGLVLYELLTGRRPYEVPRFTPRDAERIICEVEPRPPSQAVLQEPSVRNTTGATTRESLCASRGVTADELGRALRGDLDNVVLMALQKDPRRRYASAEQFSQDLQRYLGGFPVLAHRDSLGYRSRKFLRRHRAGVLAAMLCLSVLLLGIAGTTWGLLRARHEADRARREAIKADRVNVFLQDMLGAADPEIGGAELRVRDVVDRAARRLEIDPVTDREVSAAAQGTIGQTYLSLGLLEDAERHLRAATDSQPPDPGIHDSGRAKNLANLSRVLRLLGRYAEAERSANEALELDRRLHGLRHARVARDLAALGMVFLDQGDFARAEDMYRSAVAMLRELAAENDSDLAQTLEEFGVLLAQRGKIAEGERLCREALAISLRLFPDDHVRVSGNLRRLAIVLQLAHRFPESEEGYRRALAIDRKQLGDRHPNVARILSNLGPVLLAQGKREEAETVLREALELRRAIFGNGHLTVAVTLNNLATTLDAESADPLLRESLAISRKLFGDNDYRVGDACQNLAASLKDRRRYAEAEPLFREAHRILVRAFGEDHPKTTYPLFGLGEVLLRTGQSAAAESYLQQVCDTRRRTLPVGDRDRMMACAFLAESFAEQSRLAEAESVLREAIDGAREKQGLQSDEAQAALGQLVRIYGVLDRPTEEEKYRKLLRKAPETSETPGANPADRSR